MKNSLNPVELETAMHRVHRAGMPGVIAEVREGDQVWRGAAGVADVSTGRPITPDMRHRVGSKNRDAPVAKLSRARLCIVFMYVAQRLRNIAALPGKVRDHFDELATAAGRDAFLVEDYVAQFGLGVCYRFIGRSERLNHGGRKKRTGGVRPRPELFPSFPAWTNSVRRLLSAQFGGA